MRRGPIGRGEGQIVFRHQLASPTEQIVVVDVGGDGFEWSILEGGLVAVESDALYGSVEAAIRDAFCWQTMHCVVEEETESALQHPYYVIQHQDCEMPVRQNLTTL